MPSSAKNPATLAAIFGPTPGIAVISASVAARSRSMSPNADANRSATSLPTSIMPSACNNRFSGRSLLSSMFLSNLAASSSPMRSSCTRSSILSE